MDKIVFTNGCFDLIHPGHIELLEKARELGTRLIVGINSDDSVRKIKGESKPVQPQNARAAVLKGLRAVDEVRIFDELTPENLIKEINPNVLVKGGDWKESEIIGADFVKKNGGAVFSIPLKEGFSSSGIVEKIKNDDQVTRQAEPSKTDLPIEFAYSSLTEHLEVFQTVLKNQLTVINECAEIITETLLSGKKFCCAETGEVQRTRSIWRLNSSVGMRRKDALFPPSR